MNSDPIGINGGTNLYHYSRANPIAYVDPLGTSPTDPPKTLAKPNDLAQARGLGNAKRVPKINPELPGIVSRMAKAGASKFVEAAIQTVLFLKEGKPKLVKRRQEIVERHQANLRKPPAPKPGGRPPVPTGTEPTPGKRIATVNDYTHNYGNAAPSSKTPPKPPLGGAGGGQSGGESKPVRRSPSNYKAKMGRLGLGGLLLGASIATAYFDIKADFDRGDNLKGAAKIVTGFLSLLTDSPLGAAVGIAWGAEAQSKNPAIRGAGHDAAIFVRGLSGSQDSNEAITVGAIVETGVTMNLAVAASIADTAVASVKTSWAGLAYSWLTD